MYLWEWQVKREIWGKNKKLESEEKKWYLTESLGSLPLPVARDNRPSEVAAAEKNTAARRLPHWPSWQSPISPCSTVPCPFLFLSLFLSSSHYWKSLPHYFPYITLRLFPVHLSSFLLLFSFIFMKTSLINTCFFSTKRVICIYNCSLEGLISQKFKNSSYQKIRT